MARAGAGRTRGNARSQPCPRRPAWPRRPRRPHPARVDVHRAGRPWPRRAREPADGRAAPRRGALLRALGLPARGPLGRERPRRAPDAAPGRFAVKRAARILPAYWVADARLVLAAGGNRARLRGQRRTAAALRGLRAELRGLRGRQARPADVVARRRGELLRRAPARRLAARALRAARADGGGLRRAGRPRRGLERSGRAAGLARAAMSTLPSRPSSPAEGPAALAHRRVPSREVWWALVVAGGARGVNAWWHHRAPA